MVSIPLEAMNMVEAKLRQKIMRSSVLSDHYDADKLLTQKVLVTVTVSPKDLPAQFVDKTATCISLNPHVSLPVRVCGIERRMVEWGSHAHKDQHISRAGQLQTGLKFATWKVGANAALKASKACDDGTSTDSEAVLEQCRIFAVGVGGDEFCFEGVESVRVSLSSKLPILGCSGSWLGPGSILYIGQAYTTPEIVSDLLENTGPDSVPSPRFVERPSQQVSETSSSPREDAA